MTDEMVLEVPVDASYAVTARLFVVTAARDLGLPDATVDGGRSRLIIDLDAVPFMDSSGLGAIVACLKRVRESGGDLALVTRGGSPPDKLLSLTGLDRAIPTFSSVDEALSDRS